MSTSSGAKIVSPYGRQDDRYGYAVYSVVVMASLQQQATIEMARRALGSQRSMIPAHVTVKGTFCDVPGLDEVMGLVRDAAKRTAPFKVKFSGRPQRRTLDDGRKLASTPIEKTSELVALHNRVYDALAPVTANAYGDEAGEAYRPHMTVYDEPLPELEYKAPDLLDTMQLGDGFDCDSVFLMGHVGPPYRGRWAVVREFPFGAR